VHTGLNPLEGLTLKKVGVLYLFISMGCRNDGQTGQAAPEMQCAIVPAGRLLADKFTIGVY
jgi:hypothetical protein